MKIRSVEAELLYADGRTDRQTDMKKPIVCFHTFANAPNLRRNGTPGPRRFPQGKEPRCKVPNGVYIRD